MNEALTAWLMTPDAPAEPVTLEDFVRRPEWHQRAACRGRGPAEFVRPKATFDGFRELCEECPVRQECLEAAPTDSDLMGLWGGTTDAERREMRRRVA